MHKRDLLRLTDAWNNDDEQINFMGRTIQIKTRGRDTTAWDVESATSVGVERSKDSMAASKSEAVKKLISKLQEKGVIKDTPPFDHLPPYGIDDTPPQPPAEIPLQHAPLPVVPPLGPPRPPSPVYTNPYRHTQHQSNEHTPPLTPFREDNSILFPEVCAMSNTQRSVMDMGRPPALNEPNNNQIEMPRKPPKFDNNNCTEDEKDTTGISNDVQSRHISKHKELSSKPCTYYIFTSMLGLAGVLVTLSALFIINIVFANLMDTYLPTENMPKGELRNLDNDRGDGLLSLQHVDGLSNDDLMRIKNAFVNDNGQTHYKGRTIHFTTKGRVHSFSEPWVYDATAWDVESGTSVKVRHFEESEDAAKAAFEKLIAELKQKGIIKENTSGNESSGETSQPDQQQQPEQPPSHGDVDPSEGSDGREESMEDTGRAWDILWYVNRETFEEYQQFISGMFITAGIGMVIIIIMQCKSCTRFVKKGKLKSHDKYRVDGPKTIGPLSDLDDYMEVEPDGEGSYSSVHVKDAKPTPQQLNAKENYNMWSPVKGLAYILNNRYFPEREEKLQHRNGSEVDFTNMKHLFKELGYRIIPHENLESKDIRESIKKFVRLFNDDEADFSSAVVVLMSHGDTGYIRGTDERDVYLKEIQAEFEGNKCPKLQGKPKLFFIQACRGNLITTTSALATDIACDSATPPPPCTETFEVDVATDDNFAKDVPDNADMHFAYATTEGYLSLRNKVVGSWFIQVITEVFLAHAHEESLDKLMNMVTNRVSGLKGKLFDPQTKKRVTAKQTPERVTRMRKTMYFLPKYPPTY